MSTVNFTGFGVNTDAFCMEGALTVDMISAAENRMLSAFPTPALEVLRTRALQATTTAEAPPARARTVLSFAHSTDLHALFTNLLPVLKIGNMCDKRKVVDIDKDIAIALSQTNAMLRELKSLGAPDQYVDLLEVHIKDRAARNRVAGACAVVLLTAILLA